jgi:REP element-mobilizing transposase RayT
MKQLPMRPRRHGGLRKRAGRKPTGAEAGVPHTTRPALARRFPVHVTLRVRREVYNLRSQRCFRLIRRAFAAQNGRNGFQLNHFSVQGNHMHLIVEADGKQSLARGVQGLEIRIAKRLNRLMQRRGAVFADRYHAHILRTPTQTRHAVRYVLSNLQKHTGRPLLVDEYSSAAPSNAGKGLPAPPRTWLLRSALDRPDAPPT